MELAPTATANYHVARLATYAVGSDVSLVHAVDTHQVLEVSTAVLRLLSSCQGARTLTEYVDHFMNGHLSQMSHQAVHTAVEELIRSGLLRPTFKVQAVNSQQQIPRTRVRTVGIVTADRPEYVERCVTSMVASFRRFDRVVRFIVIDGSRKLAQARATRSALERAATGFPFSYIGAPEARILCERLVSKGFDRDDIRVGLKPGSIGANRNLVQLATAGEDIVMVDDDVRWEPWTSEDRSPGLLVNGHEDPRIHRHFSSRQEAFEAAALSDTDLLAEHEEMLGRSFRDLAGANGQLLDVRGACGHLLAALEQPEGFSIPVTMAGLAGDSAVHCQYGLLFSSGEALRALQSDANQFVTGLASREVHRVVRQPTVTHASSCMAYCIGLSNKMQLPPFMPLGRNEDGVFGAMLAFCHPRSLTGHLPFGIFHDSGRPSAYDQQYIASASETRISDFFLALVAQAAASFPSDDPDLRHVRLSRTFVEVGSLSQNDFQNWVVHTILEKRCREIARLDVALSAPNSNYPAYWRTALDRYRSALFRAVTRPAFFVPVEFRRRLENEGWAHAQMFVRRFGQLLAVWPQVLSESRTMIREPR